MSFKLTELYAELSVKGGSQVADSLGAIRREMIKTQRIVNSLGGEMTAGLGFANTLAARELRRGLEPVFKDLQKQTLANLGALKGWNATQMATIQGIGTFIGKIGSLEYHVGEFAKQLEGVSRFSKYAFAGGTAGILALGGAASPQALKTLTESFHWLAAEIGTAFVPTIARGAAIVQNMALAFRGLSPETKAFIGKWGTIAVVVAGVGVGVNVLVSAFTGLSAALRGVAVAYAWVAASARTAATSQAAASAVGAAGAFSGGLSLSSLAAGGAAGRAAGGAATGFGAGLSLSSLAKPAAQGAGMLGKIRALTPVLGRMTLLATVITETVDLFSDLADDLSKQFSLITPVKTLLRRAIMTATGGPVRRLIGWMTGAKSFSDEGIMSQMPGWLQNFLNVGSAGAPGQGMKVSPWGQTWMGRIEDAWRQAQMSATRGLGPESETLKVQYDSYLQLQQIAANTRKDSVGPQ